MIYNVKMEKQRNLPIGFYDSGVGGISVLKQAAALLPSENFIYYGDNANAPYGTRDEEDIKNLSLACGEFLHNMGVKMIVIACNTATSIVVQTMRERFQIPIISMEPAVKPASVKYSSGKIAVLATPATLRQKRYIDLVARLGVDDRVVNVECDGLAELVERGNLNSPQMKAFICEKLSPLRGEEVSSLVIGCTHYSFVSRQIEDVAKKLLRGSCEVFDGLYGTARRIVDVLAQEDLLTENSGAGHVAFFSSLDEQAIDVLKQFYNM